MLGTSLQRLEHALGKTQATIIYDEVLLELDLSAITSPDEELLFADQLAKRGGLLAAVASSLKVKAILAGAQKLENLGLQG